MTGKLPACIDCGVGPLKPRVLYRCLPCNNKNEYFRQRARVAVRRAIDCGDLADLLASHVSCVDCGERADRYDHRDYSKRLDVEPVCRRCNRNRGPGVLGELFKEAA